MEISILKKINMKNKLGQMMFKIRMAQGKTEELESIYREFGVADSEGNVIDMKFRFHDIQEQMYQSNKGLPYSELFPNLIYQEDFSDLILVVTSPIHVQNTKANKCLVKGSKVRGRIERYKQKLKDLGVNMEEMEFYQKWIEIKDYTTKASYEKLVGDEDFFLIEFEEGYKERMKIEQEKIIRKYGVEPEHWVIEKEI